MAQMKAPAPSSHHSRTRYHLWAMAETRHVNLPAPMAEPLAPGLARTGIKGRVINNKTAESVGIRPVLNRFFLGGGGFLGPRPSPPTHPPRGTPPPPPPYPH